MAQKAAAPQGTQENAPQDGAPSPSTQDRLEALLPGLFPGEFEEQQAGPTHEQVEEQEAEESESEETPDDAVEESEEESDGEEAEASEETESEPSPTYKVKVDGEEVEVEHDELLRGYSRTATFTKKSMALAEERKAFEAERTAVQEERKQYATYLTEIAETLKPEEPDWEAIRAETPEKLPELYADYRLKMEKFAAVEQERRAVGEKIQEENGKLLREHLKQEQAKLLEAMPGWKDEAKRTADQKALRAYAHTLGFSDADLGQIRDHRAMVLLHKAMLFDKAQKKPAGKPVVTPSGKKVLKPGSASGTKPVGRAAVEAAQKGFRKEKSVGAAARYIESLLPD